MVRSRSCHCRTGAAAWSGHGARQRPRACSRCRTTEFLHELQAAFGFRLGRFLRVGERKAYELVLSRAERHTAPRLAIVGNAAQGLHPIAGQGFNLGLRDAMSLAEVIADRRVEGMRDVGDAELLREYAEWRESDRRRIVAFTDGLVRLFTSPLGLVRGMRSVGLLAFDILPPAKSAHGTTQCRRRRTRAATRQGRPLGTGALNGRATQDRFRRRHRGRRHGGHAVSRR